MIVDINEFAKLRNGFTNDCLMVTTNGCFDIIHAGHIRLLEEARSMGNMLVVGLNSDSSVKRLKGRTRPLNIEQYRAIVLDSIRYVDVVVIFEDDTPEKFLRIANPTIHVKSEEYRHKVVVENHLAGELGFSLRYVPTYYNLSSTKILEGIGSKACGS
jgi:rfaE bifunctional protein nucleotidyltransferase chain/domain